MSKPVEAWTLGDLHSLIGVDESISLEFKRSEALDQTEHNKRELAKDVSAMANAAGGVIVYGIVEEQFTAVAVDAGTTTNTEWIDQVLGSNVQPKIAGVTFKRIPLDSGRAAVVVEVPQATTFAPHQSRSTMRYHVRRNNTVEAMADYEVRGAVRRSTTPDLWLAFSLSGSQSSDNVGFKLSVLIGNHSSEPALYHAHDLTFEDDFVVEALEGYFATAVNLRDFRHNDHAATKFTKNFAVPNHMPIFKERSFEAISVQVRIPLNMLFHFHYAVSCPGFSAERSGQIIRHEGTPRIVIEGA